MSRRSLVERLRDNRGQNLVEFGVCAVLTLMMLLVVVEFGRMVLVYTTIANAARIGVRFAMVHGSDNLCTTANIQTVVNDYLGAAAIDTSSATVTPSYPGYAACSSGSKTPGCPVKVTVSYLYQPMVMYFPISNITLSSQSQGVITF
jgi:Flp pilus assembly protein TadG